MRRLVRNLRDASGDAFVLALETVNRPSVAYRLQASVILFCNAWELLLKAWLLHNGQRVFRRKRRNLPRESLSLDECVGRLFTDVGDPVRLNIETMSELRNRAAHFVISFIPPDIMGLFQASVVNYTQRLQQWFSVSISERVPVGMMALVYDFDPSEYSLSNPRVRRRLTAETAKWLAEFQQQIKTRASGLGDRGSEYTIQIDYRVALVKSPAKADIVLGTGGGDIRGTIIEVPRDVERTHPWYERQIVDAVNAELKQYGITINGYDLRGVRKVHKIADKGEFVWQSDRTRYKPSFKDWIVTRAIDDRAFFTNARQALRRLKQRDQTRFT